MIIKAFKKSINKPWHAVTKYKRVYEHRGKYCRYVMSKAKPFPQYIIK